MAPLVLDGVEWLGLLEHVLDGLRGGGWLVVRLVLAVVDLLLDGRGAQEACLDLLGDQAELHDLAHDLEELLVVHLGELLACSLLRVLSPYLPWRARCSSRARRRWRGPTVCARAPV